MNEFDFIAGSLAFLMCLQVINTLLIGRWSGMTLGFLKLMAEGLSKEGGAKYLLTRSAMIQINRYLQEEAGQHSAKEQSDRILTIIHECGERINKI
jgi:hypothetical protein